MFVKKIILISKFKLPEGKTSVKFNNEINLKKKKSQIIISDAFLRECITIPFTNLSTQIFIIPFFCVYNIAGKK